MSTHFNRASIKKFLTANVIAIGQAVGGLDFNGRVLTTDISLAPVLISSTVGSTVAQTVILRVQVTVDTYIAFCGIDDQLTSVNASTSPALKLSAGWHYILASGDYVMASSNPTRIEIIYT